MFNKSKNPRVKRSLDKIALATYALLKTVDLRDLTVTSIATKAGVTRKTFYRNFDDVTDVLDYGFYTHVLPLYEDPKCETFYDFVLSVFGFAAQYKDVLLMCERQQQFTFLASLGLKYLPKCYYINSVVARHKDAEGFEGTFSLVVASLMVGLLEDWVADGFRKTPAEVASKGAAAIRALSEKAEEYK